MIASALPVDPALPLIPGAVLQHCMDWTTLRFDAPRLALSSAVVGGGLAEVGRWLNLRVSGEPITETPARTVARLCEARGWREPTLAMLTAASMKSLRVRRATLWRCSPPPVSAMHGAPVAASNTGTWARACRTPAPSISRCCAARDSTRR